MRFTGAIILVFSFLTINTSIAQEQLGLRLENFSGVNSLSLNPAANLSGAFSWDVNLVGGGVFGETNYGFIYQTNVSEIIRLLPEADAAYNYSSEIQFPGNTLIYDYNDNDRKKYANLSTIVMGPSFMIKLASGHSFGVFTNIRSAISAQQVPRELNYYFFDRTALGEEFNIKPFTAAGMTWSEVGVNYARRMETNIGNLDIGASVKFLNGYEAIFINNEKSFGLTQLPGDTLSFANPDLSYGLTTSNASGEEFNLNKNGTGLAFDLGAVYTIDGYEDTYQWKFGAALLDIGKINFNRNAESHKINTAQTFSIPTGDYDNVEDVDDILTMLSEQSLGDPSTSLKDRKFDIWLPGALSLQADYSVLPNVFVNATLIQRLPYRQNAVKRGNLLALTPRFEHRWLSAAIPVSLYNYNKLRVGAAIRLAFLTIGTENLTSFVGSANVTGSDIYFAIKVNPFKVGFNRGGGSSKKGKNVKCYEF
ncbi:MAG: hypothetical protein ACI8P3_003486 [Saprospiraceae bacterium]|jgi:hypothetical protein